MMKIFTVHPRYTRLTVALAIAVGTSACGISDLLQGSSGEDGTDVRLRDLATQRGAIQMHNAAVTALQIAVKAASVDIATFTDELTVQTPSLIDARINDATVRRDGIETAASQYLQTSRVQASQAVTLLRLYGGDVTRSLLGHAYAIEAHSTLLLAEMFCSGVPFTEVPYKGNIKYAAGLSTREMFERAVALFDSAYVYGKDSLPIATFASVGKGRALLSLARYAEAAQAVADVPTSAQYILTFSEAQNGTPFWTQVTSTDLTAVMNREGGRGIEWVAPPEETQDPRVPLVALSTDRWKQQKYVTGTVDLVLADGIQARLIEAEAALQPATAPAGDWLGKLNAARATLSLTPLTTDPGSAQERVDLLFKERAFWMYLTGTRLGDMRRLVRNYGRPPATVYATGLYPLPSLYYQSYGEEYVFVPPASERDLNPSYSGCIDKRP